VSCVGRLLSPIRLLLLLLLRPEDDSDDGLRGNSVRVGWKGLSRSVIPMPRSMYIEGNGDVAGRIDASK